MTDRDQIDLNDPTLPDMEVELADKSDEETLPPCEFRTGVAGTGKTYNVKQAIEEDPTYGTLTATTGIAAVNLGAITLHSALGLQPDSIEDDYATGKLQRALHRIALKSKRLVVDEMSMLGGREMLDFIFLGTQEANRYADVKEPLGITLVGDLCQLPPINQSWCFEAECWKHFQSNTHKLTKIWRQDDPLFIEGINALRRGQGKEGAEAFKGLVGFDSQADPNFDGTTIVGTNDEVTRYNNIHYLRLKSVSQRYSTMRWGKQRSEWVKNIPDWLDLKDQAYVMILANDTSKDPITKEPLLRWVNGDCGHVELMGPSSVNVRLKRTGQVETIRLIERDNGSKYPPEEFNEQDCKEAKKYGRPLPDGTYWNSERRLWIRGTIRYMPLRLAYATTVHKSQGLSLDNIQVDLRHNFVGKPSMVYVAVSRARTAKGLRLIGNADLLARRCNVDPKVAEWL